MLVAPGPDVAKHTPGFLLTRPNPSAICAADCSCLTKMCRMLHLANSSYIGRFAPPGKPNTSLTPCFSIATINALAPVIVSILFNQINLHNFNVLKLRALFTVLDQLVIRHPIYQLSLCSLKFKCNIQLIINKDSQEITSVF